MKRKDKKTFNSEEYKEYTKIEKLINEAHKKAMDYTKRDLKNSPCPYPLNYPMC